MKESSFQVPVDKEEATALPVRYASMKLADIEVFIQERKGHLDTKNSASYRIDPILSDKDTVMYLVNYEDGWELISSDKRTDPILAWCESGNIVEEDLHSNPAQSDVISGLQVYLDSIGKHKDISLFTTDNPDRGNPTPPGSFIDENGRYWVFAYRFLNSSFNQTQNPLTGLKWGQGVKNYTAYPDRKWNFSAPYDSPSMNQHCLTGCGPVAIAQTLYYLHQKYGLPSQTYHSCYTSAYLQNDTSHVSITDGNTAFILYGNHWASMPTEGSAATSTSDFQAVSTLMVEIGKKTNTSYGYKSTSTYFSSFPDAFSYYGYSCNLGNYSNIFRNQIYTRKLPVIAKLDGYRHQADSVSDFHHFVVIEGYKKAEEHYTYVYKNGDNGTFEYIYRPYVFTYEYLAVNWGYDGSGEYNDSNDIIWYNVRNTLTRTFDTGYDTGTITGLLYNFILD